MPGIFDWVGFSVWKSQFTWFAHSVWHWGRKKSIFPIALAGAYLGLDRLSTYLKRPKGLELGRTCGGKLPTGGTIVVRTITLDSWIII